MSKPEIIDASELEYGDRYFTIDGEHVGQVVTADGTESNDDVTVVRVSRAPWPDEDLVYLIKATDIDEAVEPWTLAAKSGVNGGQHMYRIVGTDHTLVFGFPGDSITEWVAAAAVKREALAYLRAMEDEDSVTLATAARDFLDVIRAN